MEYQFLGADILCSLLFIGLLVLFLFDLVFSPDKKSLVDSPLDILRRKYAAGAINTEAYQERKQVLEQDMKK